MRRRIATAIITLVALGVFLGIAGLWDQTVQAIGQGARSGWELATSGEVRDAVQHANGSDTGPQAANGAQRMLDSLTVKGKAPKTGYERDAFGPAWADTDRNGCDTRNDILARDLTAATFKPGTNWCVVLSGTLALEPYTGATQVAFEKGNPDKALDVEHVVALGNAWVSGAWQWTDEERRQFANDPANLLMADPGANRAKGDKNAAEWLPANTAYRCDYVKTQIRIKDAYDLAVTTAEKNTMSAVLATCD